MLAWGPHWQITHTALDSLGADHPLALRLGPYFRLLTNYCWMADYKRVPYQDVDQDFYADDYLLFPTATLHYDHICPEVKKTYAPYFHRALQALRTEDARNAARWVGSLLHFVEDTGSPPHAAEIRGDIHNKMENWVDAPLIRIDGYRPQEFGRTDEEALAQFLRRMDRLIEFSKERGLRCRIPVEIGNRSAVKPAVLESALETSRVVADLLHTLGQLTTLLPEHSTSLRGRIHSRTPVGMERFPAKVVIAGTAFSTLADASGEFEFHQLPPTNYALVAFRPGNGSAQRAVSLVAGQTNRCDLDLMTRGQSLVRNAGFGLHWVKPTPDCWTRTPLGWEGEIIPLKKGQSYRLEVKFKEQADGDIFVRWTRQLPHIPPHLIPAPKIDSRPLTPANAILEFTGSEQMALLQVTVRTKQDPTSVCERINLVPVAEQKQ